MPLVKIELKEGRDMSTLLKIKELVMDAVVESLQLPADDRNIRIMEYKPGLFSMKDPYEILIEIMLFAGNFPPLERFRRDFRVQNYWSPSG